MDVNLKSLIQKLNETTRQTLEDSAGLCLARTNYDIEIEHFLMKLLDDSASDAARIFHHFGLDLSRLQSELDRGLDKLKSGNARTPSISPSVLKMITEAWSIGSIDYGAEEVRSGLLVLALVCNDELARITREVSPEMRKIQPEQLRKEFLYIVDGSAEDGTAAPAHNQEIAPAPLASSSRPNMDRFTVNLTGKAREGKIDPVLGRDSEIRQVVDILMRRRQNNPILTGEAGVGKTAVVEGFALRIAQGDVPPPLRHVEIFTLDLGLLQAGAGIKGEFENRLKSLIDEVKSSPTPIILFIDEAHTMIGAGGQAGQNDAANLLKPALARGELRTIAATTWSEYKKYFEKDPALARRFQVVKVEEPDEATCMTMLRGIVAPLEKHHGVRILDEGLTAAVRLSHRYIAGRQLPDKAVSVLDTACARLALSQNSTPAAIEQAINELDDLAVQSSILEREALSGADHAEKLALLAAQRDTAKARLQNLMERFRRERELVAISRNLRGQLEAAGLAATERDRLRQQLSATTTELDALQGDAPLMRVCVDAHTVSEVISAWTGIPVGKMMRDDLSSVLTLEHSLGQRVLGQTHALEQIAERIRTSRAGLEDPNKPVGVFLLVGPSGVGKTETALALADLMFGGERNLITINMSEFQEAHSVSTLKGSPPGYVGYGEGGVLTEAVRRRPYSVVLLDEAEKAHPDVLELFYQIFDKGTMEDGEGREIDFKNTIIILTTNVGSEKIVAMQPENPSVDLSAGPCVDPCLDPCVTTTPAANDAAIKLLKPELNRIFKPAFLGRTVIIPYFPVRDEALKSIILLKLEKIQTRLLDNHKIRFTWDQGLVDEIARRCTEVESGARNVDNILTHTLLPQISRRILTGMAARGPRPQEIRPLKQIAVSAGPDGAFVYA